MRQENVRNLCKKYEIYILPQIAWKSVDVEVECQTFLISQILQVLSFQNDVFKVFQFDLDRFPEHFCYKNI